MTIEIPFRSVTRSVNVYANCRGVNHSDSGEIVVHDRCGAQVVRRDDGRIFNVEISGFYAARKFSCYHPGHQCDPAAVAQVAAERAAAVAAGTITKGAEVVVFKGRKVPRGTVGVVFWEGEDSYSGKPKIGIRSADGERFFLLAEHCRIA